jgi:tRNA pseudouridine13 synthase
VPGAWTPPESERAIGLGFYATSTAPVAATLKGDADDFVVREISSYPMPDPGGRFAVLRVRSRNWEQHELAARLESRLGLGRNAIAWAGTKDRRAVAERLLSYQGRVPDRPIELPGVELMEAYQARDGLSLGHHYGNSFSIRLTEVDDPAIAAESFRRSTAELVALTAVPNFFGPQRFGEVRPVTHLVGQALAAGDTAAAVEVYLAGLPESSGEEGRTARLHYAETHDARRALEEFPSAYRFERQMLERLARGATPESALRALSRELRLLFVHAVQSWMFNRWLTARVEAGLSLVEPEAGDTILRVARDGTVPSRDPVPVDAGNLFECRETVRRGRARLAAPLIGYGTERPSGRPGELYDRVLRETGVTPNGFRLPSFPEISSAGAWRASTIAPPPVGIAVVGESTVRVDFALPKGSYATVLVREFLKPGAGPPGPADGPGPSGVSNRRF